MQGETESGVKRIGTEHESKRRKRKESTLSLTNKKLET
jgi:hypothetical protein